MRKPAPTEPNSVCDVALEQVGTKEDASGDEDSDAHMSESLSLVESRGRPWRCHLGPVAVSAALLRATKLFARCHCRLETTLQ